MKYTRVFRRAVGLLLTVCLLFALSAVPVVAYDAYVFSYTGDYQASVPVYLPVRQLSLSDILQSSMKQVTDIVYDGNGLLYCADAENNRILVLEEKGTVVREIAGYTDTDGVVRHFSKPSGLCIKNGELYIADTGNSCVVVLDTKGAFRRVIGTPTGTGIAEDFVYMPISVAVDDSRRTYVVSQSSNMGVLCFDEKGQFDGFMGAQTVTPTASELFWRTFMTAEQREKAKKQIPADYCDIEIDQEGFVYAVSVSIDKNLQYSAMFAGSPASDYAPVKRLSTSGNDVLKRNGFYPPAGEMELATGAEREKSISAFAGVTVNELGIYSVIDSNNNKIFTYDDAGNLLCAFGGDGSSLGQFVSVTAITSFEDRLAVLDMLSGTITVFELSDYGRLIFEAIALTEERRYDEALEKWTELLPLNANLDNVYIDLGDAYLRGGDYEKAMEHFRMVNNKEQYSEAFSLWRDQYVAWLLVGIPLAAILIAVAFSAVMRRVKAANKKDDLTPGLRVTFRKQLCYSGYVLFHPFDGFYQIRRHGRGRLGGAAVISLAAMVSVLLYRYLSGYIFASTRGDTNLLQDVLQLIFPVVVFVLANYCVTSLMDGEGSLKIIAVATGYALLPLCLILPLCTVAANLCSLEEGQLLAFAVTVAYAWCGFLLVFGLQTVHGYSLGRNILSLLLTVIAMAAIMFLVLLAVAIGQKMVLFVHSLITEFSWRI